jgi:hypothetical protein
MGIGAIYHYSFQPTNSLFVDIDFDMIDKSDCY